MRVQGACESSLEGERRCCGVGSQLHHQKPRRRLFRSSWSRPGVCIRRHHHGQASKNDEVLAMNAVGTESEPVACVIKATDTAKVNAILPAIRYSMTLVTPGWISFSMPFISDHSLLCISLPSSDTTHRLTPSVATFSFLISESLIYSP